MIIVVQNSKGGVGKTTTCANLASSLSNHFSVACLDTDTQGSLTKWTARRKENFPDLPEIYCEQATGKIAKKIVEMDQKFDILLIDVKGSDSSIEAQTAAKLAHLMVVPTTSSYIELEVFEEMADVIEDFILMNQKLKVRVVLNRVTNNFSREPERAAGYLAQVQEAYPEIQLLKSRISEKKVFQQAFEDGASVFEINTKYAKDSAKEVDAVINEIMFAVGIEMSEVVA